MKIKNALCSFIAGSLLLCSVHSYAGNSVVASGEASEDLSGAAVHLVSASANLSSASLYLSSGVAISLGCSISTTIINGADISGDAVVFSADVLADGLMTTARLSKNLTMAGIQFSGDATLLAAQAAGKGIYISTETAAVFLNQAVNIVAASGRLSGETAELAVLLTAAGVELSADSAILVANAGKKGIYLSADAADNFIANSLHIASECIDSAVIAERYIIMTAKEANRILAETSIATVQKTIEAGKTTYVFSKNTASHLKSLGIDASKYTAELTIKAANTVSTTFINTLNYADNEVVIVINTGSGLIIASIDSLTAAVEEKANTLK